MAALALTLSALAPAAQGFEPAGTGDQPLVETTGSPVRTDSTADLAGRLNPENSPTDYRFEYGSAGPCDANPCSVTPFRPGGSGGLTELVNERVDGLQPGTTYHYRIVADNGTGSPSMGDDMTITTRPTDAPLAHGALPGPPGSDRAWELVSLPDSGGNPVVLSFGYSSSGDRALYGVFGGTPIAESGNLLNLYLAEREEEGPHLGRWHTGLITPPRSQWIGPNWGQSYAAADLSSVVALNSGSGGQGAIWRLGPESPQAELLQLSPPQQTFTDGSAFGLSSDGGKLIAALRGGSLDPTYPDAASVPNLYDLSDGSPRLVSLLPGGAPSPCGATGPLTELRAEESNWISPEGTLLVFQSRAQDCSGPFDLFLRELPAGATKLIATGDAGLGGAAATFLKLTPDGLFFTTEQSISAGDGGGNDVYRYQPGTEEYECVTCVLPDTEVEVHGGTPLAVAVSDDGSRVYFKTDKRLLPQAPPSGADALYRVNVDEGSLAYVAPVLPSQDVGSTNAGVSISTDGAFYAFPSADDSLNPLGGPSNGQTSQFYLYDDHDRSLTCVSCPRGGALPQRDLNPLPRERGPNLDLLADDGSFAFMTTEPLVDRDQNTPSGEDRYQGADVYEWRDGRQLLVSDGQTEWPRDVGPMPISISPSGRDLFFLAASQYTPDAVDSYFRIYDARIGGGFEFPGPPAPCPLDACQGQASAEPDQPVPGTSRLRPRGPAIARNRCDWLYGRAKSQARLASRLRVRVRRLQRFATHLPSSPRRRRLLRTAQRLLVQADRHAVAAQKRREAVGRCHRRDRERR